MECKHYHHVISYTRVLLDEREIVQIIELLMHILQILPILKLVYIKHVCNKQSGAAEVSLKR